MLEFKNLSTMISEKDGTRDWAVVKAILDSAEVMSKK